MSFCPTKDIHSVYLDNELPEAYKKEYEAHIESCEKCRKELEALKALHATFKADSDSITPDEHFMDESYNRLLLKMSYSKNTAKSSGRRFVRPAFYLPVAAAAAAAFRGTVGFRPGNVAGRFRLERTGGCPVRPAGSALVRFISCRAGH